MMEENNENFLLAVMLQCTWPNQYTKNISQNLFGAIHLVRTYLMTNFSTPLPLYPPVHILDDSPPFSQLLTYLMDGLFLNQKTNNNIQISYSPKYKHLKKRIKSKNQQRNVSYALQRKTPAQQLKYFHTILQVSICLLSIFQSHTRPKILHLVSVTLSHINGIIIVHFKSYLNQCF